MSARAWTLGLLLVVLAARGWAGSEEDVPQLPSPSIAPAVAPSGLDPIGAALPAGAVQAVPSIPMAGSVAQPQEPPLLPVAAAPQAAALPASGASPASAPPDASAQAPASHWLVQFAKTSAAAAADPAQGVEALHASAEFDLQKGGEAGTPALRETPVLSSEHRNQGWTRVAYFKDDRTVFTAGMDGAIRLLDLRSGRVLRRLPGHLGVVRTLNMTPDKRYLFSTDDAGAILRWDLKHPDRMPLQLQSATGAAVRAIDVSPDGKTLVTGGHDGAIMLWDAVKGRRIRSVFHGSTVYALSYSKDGRFVFGAGKDGVVRRIGLNGGAVVEFRGHAKAVRALAVSPDGKLLMTAAEDGTIRSWDARTGKALGRYDVPSQWARSLAFAPDGRSVYAGNINGAVDRLALGQDGAVRKAEPLYRHDDVIFQTLVSPKGDYVLSTGRDLRIGVLGASGRLRQVRGTGGPVHAMFFLNDHALAGVSHDGHLLAWEIGERSPIRLAGHEKTARALAVAPGGAVATGGDDARILLRRPELSEPLVLKGHVGRVRALAFSPDQKILASGGDDGVVRLWDAVSGALLRQIPQPTVVDVIHALAFSPDGRALAVAGRDGVVRLWSPRTGELISQWEQMHQGYIRSMAFSADGSKLVTGGRDGSLWVWDARAGRAVQELVGHTDDIMSVEFDPAGRRVLSASDDKTMRLWDLETGQAKVFRGVRPISAARFSPDGKTIVAVDDWQSLLRFEVR